MIHKVTFTCNLNLEMVKPKQITLKQTELNAYSELLTKGKWNTACLLTFGCVTDRQIIVVVK